jgi:hypothetical protein
VTRRGDCELLAGVSGCSRLWSGICGECARKLLAPMRFGWSEGCRPWSVNPSRKLRRFESFTCHRVRERASDLRKRGSEALVVYPMGVSKRRLFGDPHGFGSQACDLRKCVNLIGWRWVRPENARKFGSMPPCWPDSLSAGLRGRWGWGYVSVVEADTFAIGHRQCRSFSSGDLSTESASLSLDHPVDGAPSRLTCGVPYDARSREWSPGRSYGTIMQGHGC